MTGGQQAECDRLSVECEREALRLLKNINTTFELINEIIRQEKDKFDEEQSEDWDV